VPTLHIKICRAVLCTLLPSGVFAQSKSPVRPSTSDAAGCSGGRERGAVPEPQNLRSEQGVLKAELSFRSRVDAQGFVQYCYVSPDGRESPNLRAHSDDTLILNLKNEFNSSSGTGASATLPLNSSHHPAAGGCSAGGPMITGSTNLHFHGLALPQGLPSGRDDSDTDSFRCA
jgi:FtsP/CotA-like multicopper oxidase with cupredoxin domain